jgi:hypothetical protein
MQEHRKKANKASAKVEDNWKHTNAYFENVLNSKDKTLMKYLERMHSHLCFEL